MENLKSQIPNPQLAVRHLLSISLCLWVFAGCHSKEKVNVQNSLTETGLTRREIIGERLYLTYCAGCHGETGEGDGLHSFTLNPPPANHADSSLMSTLSDKYLLEVIRKGGASAGKSPEMPRWGDVLNKNQIENVIIHVRTLPEKKASGQTVTRMRDER